MEPRAAESPATVLERSGPSALSTAELLSLVLCPSPRRPGRSLALVSSLVDRFGHPSRLGRASVGELRTVRGVGPVQARRISAALELGRRSLAPATTRPRLSSSREVAEFFLPILGNRDVEHFCTALLDTRNRLLRQVLVATGTVNACFIHPREIFRAAITESACALILIHNHPSGELTPSDEDLALTRRVVDAGAIVGIRVLDHVIVGPGGHFSFLDAGLLSP